MEAWQAMEAARDGMQSLTMRIGNFNSGVHQPQLTGKNKNKVLFNVNKIIHVSVQESQLDMMSLCEVGGHMQGFPSAGISARNLPVLDPTHGAEISIIQNYMTCWGFQADAFQPGFQKLRQHEFTLSAATEPQLVVEVFSFNDQVKLVKGNLHIRIPTNTTVTQTQRKRLVTQALHQLEAIAKKEQQRYNDAPQPIVCVLLGDTNLEAAGGNEAVQPLQPTRDRTWEHA
jgi:hypothetical protein